MDHGNEYLLKINKSRKVRIEEIMSTSIQDQLIELSESEYRTFSSKLLPGTNNILGVRLPNLHKIAKQIAKEDWRAFLSESTSDYFEETLLQGMVIGYVKADIEEILYYVKLFIPRINNWSVCDSFCCGLKITKKHPKEMWEFLQTYLTDSREYYIRFGAVMLLNYYINEEYIDEALQALDHIESDAYYVRMGVAWAISMYYVKFPNKTLKYLKNNTLDNFTYNKTLQKITESRKVDKEMKSIIRSMKRK
jgi:3-methyladenine DNA glycosylase AlkD